VFEGGTLAPPQRAGLGMDLDRDALERFETVARDFARR
jgi:L-alanine-DL-glutamate epimerase-like enolase superfamily enzyme